jgi:hypothetical protein
VFDEGRNCPIIVIIMLKLFKANLKDKKCH